MRAHMHNNNQGLRVVSQYYHRDTHQIHSRYALHNGIKTKKTHVSVELDSKLHLAYSTVHDHDIREMGGSEDDYGETHEMVNYII